MKFNTDDNVDNLSNLPSLAEVCPLGIALHMCEIYGFCNFSVPLFFRKPADKTTQPIFMFDRSKRRSLMKGKSVLG